MSCFGEELRRARKNLGYTQKHLAEIVGVAQAWLAQIEGGKRGVERSPEVVSRLESALGVPPGTLAQHLPEDHPARRLAEVALPVLQANTGLSRKEPPNESAVLRLNALWAGCVAYRVSTSVAEEQIREGDYLIVRPVEQPEVGQVVVVWLEGVGQAIKRYAARGYLRSTGKDRWSHKLTGADRILGVLVGLVRLP
jgi:transcriptional regulator with XRE-family HTH domain